MSRRDLTPPFKVRVTCGKCGKKVDAEQANRQVDGSVTCDPCIDAYRKALRGASLNITRNSK